MPQSAMGMETAKMITTARSSISLKRRSSFLASREKNGSVLYWMMTGKR